VGQAVGTAGPHAGGLAAGGGGAALPYRAFRRPLPSPGIAARLGHWQGGILIRQNTRTVPGARASGLGAVIWSQLFLRVASSAGLLVIGSYLVDLRDHGAGVTSFLVGVLTALVYVTELLGAPLAGTLSDARGRKAFLLAGPALSALAVLLIPLGSLGAALPPLVLVLVLVGAARLIEGLGSALSVPATLSLLAEGTDARPLQRGRLMSLFELSTSGGLALGAVLGPILWQRLHLLAFAVLAALYLGASAVVARVREAPLSRTSGDAIDLRRSLPILARWNLALFVPAWIAVNAIVGVWITAQIAFVLTARLHVHGQRFVGSLHGRPGTLSAILGGYVLWFSLCVVVWAVALGRLPRLPVLLVTTFGAVLASAGLIALNHGGAPAAFIPLVLTGVFLEAGFTPAALAYLADASRAFTRDRGLLMGLYSVILGVGQLIGNVLGGIAAQVAYFDGLAYLTILLAVVALAAVTLLLVAERRQQRRMAPVRPCISMRSRYTVAWSKIRSGR
jgi:MFS family permease